MTNLNPAQQRTLQAMRELCEGCPGFPIKKELLVQTTGYTEDLIYMYLIQFSREGWVRQNEIGKWVLTASGAAIGKLTPEQLQHLFPMPPNHTMLFEAGSEPVVTFVEVQAGATVYFQPTQSPNPQDFIDSALKAIDCLATGSSEIEKEIKKTEIDSQIHQKEILAQLSTMASALETIQQELESGKPTEQSKKLAGIVSDVGKQVFVNCATPKLIEAYSALPGIINRIYSLLLC